MKMLIIILSIFLSLNLLGDDDNKLSVDSGKRAGFFVGFSAGFAYQNMNFLNNSKSQRKNLYSGVSTSFKAGLFLDEHFAIFYSNYTTFFSAPYKNGNLYTNKIYLDALNGLGMSYFFTENKSYFISGSIGSGVFKSIDKHNANFGTAYLLSFGYELDNNMNIELVVKRAGKYDNRKYNNLSLDAQSTQILVGYTFY